MSTIELEISGPPAAGSLLVLSTTQRLTYEQAETLRAQGEGVVKRIQDAIKSGVWPVVIVCDMDLSVEWISAPLSADRCAGCDCKS